jgi:hypothetical protein
MKKTNTALLLAALMSVSIACSDDQNTHTKLESSHGKYAVNTATLPAELSDESQTCIACHKKENKSLYQQWGGSKHFRANVGCFECHEANRSDPDAFEHHGQHISVIVSPQDCAQCHSKEVKEFTSSHHAKAGRIMGSLDNLLAEVVEGNNQMVTEGFPDGISAAAVNGCWQCHGSEVKVLKNGKLDPATWPNSGMGRINPDGSEGSCSACHSRHAFSAAQARSPENCGKCHMGPDHPQIESYTESKHGISFYANRDKMNLDNPKWVVGEDYDAAPTCATCHMSATQLQGVTHDVGLRISWNNRPPKSIRPEVSDAKLGLPTAAIKWQERRKNMQDVCIACHDKQFTENFYVQYDELIHLYNNKFAEPGLQLMAAAKPLLKPVKFSNELDFIWFEIWHHEGRRARHGASMMAPDITHWHGTYEVAKHFYEKFIPKLKKLAKEHLEHEDPEKKAAAKKLKELIHQVLNSDDHKWYLGKENPEAKKARQDRRDEFKKRYE